MDENRDSRRTDEVATEGESSVAEQEIVIGLASNDEANSVDPEASGGDESEADPGSSSNAEIIEISVPMLPYLPPNRWVAGKTVGELEDRLRGWTIISALPEDHDLSLYELQQYDMLLQARSVTSGPYPVWNDDWRERLTPEPVDED